MTAIEIITIVACVLIVGGVLTASIVNKKKGKTSCGCDCASCSGCAYKRKKDNIDKKTKN